MPYSSPFVPFFSFSSFLSIPHDPHFPLVSVYLHLSSPLPLLSFSIIPSLPLASFFASHLLFFLISSCLYLFFSPRLFPPFSPSLHPPLFPFTSFSLPLSPLFPLYSSSPISLFSYSFISYPPFSSSNKPFPPPFSFSLLLPRPLCPISLLHIFFCLNFFSSYLSYLRLPVFVLFSFPLPFSPLLVTLYCMHRVQPVKHLHS